MSHHIKSIETKDAPLPIGSYSQAVKVDKMVFVSGQIPLDPHSNTLHENFSDQIAQVFKNIEAVAHKAGASLSDVVKYNIYLTDLGKFSEVNDYMNTHFQKPFPARATVEVSALPKGAQIEIDAILAIG